MIYKNQYEGTLHLLESDGMELCLDASPRRRLTSKEFGGGSFSPCKWDANQVLIISKTTKQRSWEVQLRPKEGNTIEILIEN